jgi:pilus assembly protein Flp/PilA
MLGMSSTTHSSQGGNMLARIRQMLKREEGASAVEYGLLVAGIAAIIVVAVFALGTLVNETFEGTADAIEGEQAPAGG